MTTFSFGTCQWSPSGWPPGAFSPRDWPMPFGYSGPRRREAGLEGHWRASLLAIALVLPFVVQELSLGQCNALLLLAMSQSEEKQRIALSERELLDDKWEHQRNCQKRSPPMSFQARLAPPRTRIPKGHGPIAWGEGSRGPSTGRPLAGTKRKCRHRADKAALHPEGEHPLDETHENLRQL